MDHLIATVKEFVLDHRDEMVRLLKQLVTCETPTNVYQSHGLLFELIRTHLERSGYWTTLIPGRSRSGGHLYARPENKSKNGSQLMVGHGDTVWPVGTLAHMPFVLEENTIRGPGVYDMKGGLVQGLFALRALHQLGLKPELMPLFFINSDEEIGSPDSSRYIRLLGKCVRRAFVLEPALDLSGKLKTARKGAGRFVIHVEGQHAHAGLNPGKGASAIVELAHVIQQLHALNDLQRGITVNVGQIEGGVRPNVVAPVSKAIIDVRVRNLKDGEYIERQIYGLTAKTQGTRLTVEGHIGKPPMEFTRDNQALWQAARYLGDQMGLRLDNGTAGGVSDGNTLSQHTATLDGMGAVGDGAHATHEFLYIDNMLERTILLTLLLMLPQDLSLITKEHTRQAAKTMEESL